MSGSTADRSPWASFPWVLASQPLADERWEWHSPWAGRGQGGPSCWMPFPHVASPDKCHQSPKVPPLPTMPSLLSCLAYLQAVKHWGIVGLSFFPLIYLKMSICFESFTKLWQRCRKKRKTSCFCLLKMLYFNCSLPFLSSLPPRLTRSLCIFIMAVTWRKGRIACPHARWYSSSSSSLFILFITCNWSFLRYHYCNYLEEIDEKKIPRQFHATELLQFFF